MPLLVTLGPAPVGAVCVAMVAEEKVADLACSGAPSLLIASLVPEWTVPAEPSLLTITQTASGAEVHVEPALPLVPYEELTVRDAPVPPGADGWTGSCLLRLRVAADGTVKGAWSAPQPLAGAGPQPPECPPTAEKLAEQAVLEWKFKPPKRSDVLTTATVTFIES